MVSVLFKFFITSLQISRIFRLTLYKFEKIELHPPKNTPDFLLMDNSERMTNVQKQCDVCVFTFSTFTLNVDSTNTFARDGPSKMLASSDNT